jgi:uncharacterized protein YkwD
VIAAAATASPTTTSTTTTTIDPDAAGPADVGGAAPVRGEPIQLTPPVLAPATTTTTPPTTAPPPPAPAPATPAPAPATPAPVPAQLPATISAEAIELTNQERAAAGLPPLGAHGALNQAAAVHSADQAAHNRMSHTGSDGSDGGQRITAAGYSGSTWGENVAGGFGSASSVVAAWMNSPGHRANILNPAFTDIGVAWAAAADGTVYWTMALGG